VTESSLPEYEMPRLIVYGAFRDLTQIDWSLGIYPVQKVAAKKPTKPFKSCVVSGFGSSPSCSTSSSP
jgi:hypothetical protein